MNNKFEKLKTPFLISIAGLIVILMTIFLFHSNLEQLNNKFYDFKLKTCSIYRSDKDQIRKQIVTIFVDDVKTIPKIGYPTPQIHAQMINKLKKIETKYIFYDFIIRGDIHQDLIQATKNAENVYWPVSFYLSADKKNANLLNQFSAPFQEIIIKNSLKQEKNLSGLWYAGPGSLSNENILNGAKGIGHICTGNEENEANIIFRKVALIIDVDGYVFPSIDLIIACDYFEVSKDKIIVKPGEAIILPNAKLPDGKFSDVEIPINSHGEMLINYIKPWKINKHDFLEPFWFISVLNPEEKPEREEESKLRLKNKICIVGNASSINKDIHYTPIDDAYPGIGIHSHILYTILSRTFIKEMSLIKTFFLTSIFILIIILVTYKKNGLTIFFASLISIILYFIFSYAAFIISGISFADLIPVSGLFMFGSLNLIGDYFFREKKLKNLENQLTVLDNELTQKNTIINKTQNELNEEVSKREASVLTIQNLENIIKTNKEEIDKIKKEQEKLQIKISELTDKTVFETNEQKPDDNTQALIKECASFGIITQSKNMLELFKMVKKIADNDKPILILGDSGTGKELFAKAIHKLSPRKEKTMIIVNIPAVSDTLLESTLFGHVKGSFTGATENKKGKFELADKSTIFLDEIGDMKFELQTKLLRVLQEKTIDKVGDSGINPFSVDVRIVAATNKDLEKEIKNNNFREDLFYRLNVFTIKLPPLKDRKDDIPLIVNNIIEKSKYPDKKISQKAINKLMSYSWSNNNIRELENVIFRAMELSDKSIIRDTDIQLPEKQEEADVASNSNLTKFGSIPDEEFWETIEKNNFEITITAEIFKQSRGTITSRFKGICFQRLSENKWDINKTLENLTDNLKHRQMLKDRLEEYYQNIISVIKEYKDKKSAKEECSKRFKNLPKKYIKYIDELIDRQE